MHHHNFSKNYNLIGASTKLHRHLPFVITCRDSKHFLRDVVIPNMNLDVRIHINFKWLLFY